MSAGLVATAERQGDAVVNRGDQVPLALRGICKRWAADRPPVLDELDLRLDLGSKTWIGGRNGVGKTTLLRIAAGLIDPDRGRAEVWGFTARERHRRYQRLVSFLPAGDRGLYARLTVRHQLEFWARIALVERGEVKSRTERAIEEFDLGDLAEHRVDRMSMGQRQRLRIAMTFLPEPETVLLDEPLTSLDAEGGVVLERAIDGLIARHGALLWCSPSGEHLDQEFDTRLVLENGKLVPA
ncbi:MAG TPA: ABC transporter ATP-binding protein [Solirubrobacterales bacterium]|nr:ABC transporter ATP-binding protein [Solirubrobacterales bacterium]